MLIEEAKWFGKVLSECELAALTPMLNVGSSTGEFRSIDQPWIEEWIFDPFLRRGGEVVHLDLKAAPGVDVVGDLTDSATRDELARQGFRSLFCSNLLEHVADRQSLCRAMLSMLPEGGLLFASCPRSYPYHPDPIDTMFRPDVHELATAFPGTSVLRGDVVDCGTYLRHAFRSVPSAIRTVGRLSTPFYRSAGWKMEFDHIPWLFRQFEASCVVLAKQETPVAPEPAREPAMARAIQALPGSVLSSTRPAEAPRTPAHRNHLIHQGIDCVGAGVGVAGRGVAVGVGVAGRSVGVAVG